MLKIPLLVPFVISHHGLMLHVAQEVLRGGSMAAQIAIRVVIVVFTLVHDVDVAVLQGTALVVGILGHGAWTRRAPSLISVPLRDDFLSGP